MKKIFTKALVALSLVFCSAQSDATVYYVSGNYSNNDFNALGLNTGDMIVIPSTLTLTLQTNVSISANIIFNVLGTLSLSNKDLTLSNTNASINLWSTGAITGTGKITIVSNVAYNNSTITAPSSGNVKVSNAGNTWTTTAAPRLPSVNPLPLKFISFEASVKSSTVSLNWTATNDGPATMFAVQQSTDGKNWNEVATVKATGGDHETVSYTYSVAAPKTATAIYRLRYMGTNESEVVYSAARLVNLGGATNQTTAVIGAQSGRIQIGLSATEGRGATTVIVTTMDGKVVYTGQYSVENTSITVPVTASGILAVTVTDGSTFKIAQKVAVL